MGANAKTREIHVVGLPQGWSILFSATQPFLAPSCRTALSLEKQFDNVGRKAMEIRYGSRFARRILVQHSFDAVHEPTELAKGNISRRLSDRDRFSNGPDPVVSKTTWPAGTSDGSNIP